MKKPVEWASGGLKLKKEQWHSCSQVHEREQTCTSGNFGFGISRVSQSLALVLNL